MKVMAYLMVCCVAAGAIILPLAHVEAGEGTTVELPAPDFSAGGTLMEALQARQSTKSEIGGEVSRQTLSDLLWAAWGVNRPETGKRTAPSSRNFQELDLYVATEDGLFVYNAQAHALDQLDGEDAYRRDGAPVTLYIVADFARAGDASDEDKWFAAAANSGYISQNVYLFCASRALATCVKDGHKSTQLAEALRLREDQHLVLYQLVGEAI